MQILNDRQIRQKIKRIAIEILEHNFGEAEIILAGMNNNGLGFAQLLLAELTPIAPKNTAILLTRIRLNPANPVEYDPTIELPAEALRDKPVIIVDYTEDEIKSLDWREHIRLRPGMYIGKLGDGSSPEDGIYVLLKEVLDNSIDEYAMGYGK
jgi:hypoxanthine-guanine phosphoribosyltransferase